MYFARWQIIHSGEMFQLQATGVTHLHFIS